MLDDNLVAGLCELNKIKIWNYLSGGLVKTIQESEDMVQFIKLHSSHLAVVCCKKINIWDYKTGKKSAFSFSLNDGIINCAELINKEEILIIGERKSYIKNLFNQPFYFYKYNFMNNLTTQKLKLDHLHLDKKDFPKFMIKLNKNLLAACDNKTIALINVSKSALEREMIGYTNIQKIMKFKKEHMLCVDLNKIIFYNYITGIQIKIIDKIPYFLNLIKINENILLANDRDMFYVWDFHKGCLLEKMPNSEGVENALIKTSNNKFIGLGSDFINIKIMKIKGLKI